MSIYGMKIGIFRKIGIISIILISSLLFAISSVHDYSVYPINRIPVSKLKETYKTEIISSWPIPVFPGSRGEVEGKGEGKGS